MSDDYASEAPTQEAVAGIERASSTAASQARARSIGRAAAPPLAPCAGDVATLRPDARTVRPQPAAAATAGRPVRGPARRSRNPAIATFSRFHTRPLTKAAW